MHILVLEDNHLRIAEFVKELGNKHDLVICTTVKGFKTAYAVTDLPDIVFLDHDLGGETFVDDDHENCGMRVAEFIAEHEVASKRIIIHSANTVAAQRMAQTLSDVESIERIVLAPFASCNLSELVMMYST